MFFKHLNGKCQIILTSGGIVRRIKACVVKQGKPMNRRKQDIAFIVGLTQNLIPVPIRTDGARTFHQIISDNQFLSRGKP